MRTIKAKICRLLVMAGFLLPSSAFPQISLNGTVDVFNYVGSQPDLIHGISSVPASGNPLIRHVYMAGRNVLGMVIDENTLIPSKLEPYRKQDNDTMVLGGFHGLNKYLVRCGDTVGYLCGRKNDWYRPFNEIAGKSLNLKWISGPSDFVITSPDDPQYSQETHPLGVSRKSVPKDEVSRLSLGGPVTTHRHFIYLKLPADLIPGKHYRVTFHNNINTTLKEVSFLFSDRKLRSEAIHVNLYGYEPDDRKVAFLSTWLGEGGVLQYPGDLHFRIVNLENGQTMYEGPVKLKQPADKPEYVIGGKAYNQNKTDVWMMDFSPLHDKGNYKLVVDGIGCSFDFLIDKHIWENTARLLMKGFLHQRAGIELGPPYTDYVRPRNLHPADGHTIHKCDPQKFFESRARVRGQFTAIQASILEGTSVPEAWGGWMDAGDYDRRMTHFYSVRRMMYLCELNPEYFEQLDFNIPESNNQIPDILDEALWCLDLYRRTQGVYEKGAVSWQVESIEHPRRGETSWLNSLPTALLPPTLQAGISYAGTAAHMALILKKYDEDLAAAYEESALDAMKWVSDHPDAPGSFRGRDDVENIAYINLYRLTGDEMWHRRFRDNFKNKYPDGIAGHLTLNEVDPAAIYALMTSPQADLELQSEIRKAIINLADELLDGAGETTYGILRLKDRPLSRPAVLRSKVLPVVIAHKLTGDRKYRDALVTTIQYTMGLNPINRSYISGLGERSFMPYHHDWHADMLKIPAGIPNFGPVLVPENPNERAGMLEGWSDERIAILEKMGIYPAKLTNWPLPEACFDQIWLTPINEFMVEYPMGEQLLLSGYLGSCAIQ